MHEIKTNTLSNGWLTVLVLFISLVFLSVVYRSMLKNNPNQTWGVVQKQNLPEDLSGQTNATIEDLKAGNVNGKFIRLPILAYNHIGAKAPISAQANPAQEGLTVSLKSFEEQVMWLKAAGYSSISLQNLLDYSRGKFEMPKNPIILTFDGGYEDAVLNAPPILKKYGFTGSFAIITRLTGIKYDGSIYATWLQIKSLKSAGMEIVSHTQDHFDADNAKYEDGFILQNLTNARSDIKDNLGLDTKVLIYPFGHYNDRYLKFAKEAGYEMGVTIEDSMRVKLDKLFEIPRIRISNNTTLTGFKKLLAE